MRRQRLGQHFLASSAWRERILRTLSLRAGETWVEIGAGHGEMTQLLTGSGRRIIAIETDAQLAAGLRELAAAWPGVEVVGADALSVDFEALAHERFRVYGNLPYYITSPLLHRLFRCADAITSIHVVIQLEVALRIVAAGRRDYGYLSVLCQYYSRPQIIFRIPSGAFRPPPRVTSALVQMQLPGERMALGITDDASFLSFVQVCFGQKRKTLRNNLRSVASAALVQTAMEACDLSNHSRAEELTLRQLADLYIRLHRA